MNDKKKSELDYAAIGKRLKFLRGNMQQLDFAELFGIKRQQDVSKMENGKLKPSLDILRKISLHFNRPIEWLLICKDASPDSNGNPHANAVNLPEGLLSQMHPHPIPTHLPFPTSTDAIKKNIPYDQSSIDDQSAQKYANYAYDILSSGTGYANALRENIFWFRRAVESENRMQKLEDDISKLKDRLSEFGILPSR